ncbi:NFX1-type zinc finger-containing protein 1-like [Physella acuta]|uniref:NFX1-type zinc finger-containing protein 1-like n=1 Tax=Physella acuta TaxID=109671 RepID=UPI0027DDEE0E|nr:NFX1-type zinc finger-containing protein 1-like [Physella acuta]
MASRDKAERPLSVQELDDMLKNQRPSDILLRISRPNGGFGLLLESATKQREIDLIVKVLGTVLGSKQRAQRQAINDVVDMFINANNFQDSMSNFLQGKLGQDQVFVKAVLAILKESLEALPNIAAKKCLYLFTTLEQVIDKRFKDMLQEKETVKEMIHRPFKLALEENEEEMDTESAIPDEEVDPNLFRGLSIVPTAADFDPTQDIIIRANKIKGHYQNVNDYLDIQFRLLRADLVIPLRENIHKFLDQEDKRIRAYSQVRIVRPVCHDKGLCFKLSFDVSKHRRVNWAVSQRLKYGSLLCLSSDNFNTYRCAVVENREPKELAKGLVDVQFVLHEHEQGDEGQGDFTRFLSEARDQRFVMVESPTYFEAYKYVLQSLQNITENNFPFWEYIGECSTALEPPAYLQNNDHPTYDLRPLVDAKFVIKEDQTETATFSREAEPAKEVNILDPESWPKANTFQLDHSQFVALQAALKHKFSIIQGPPGTGKTFIGLMVMKALLWNKQIWTGDEEQKPILLVCYTNHALDQFLEGILNFFQGKMVRVGSRSKSERLEEYNLRGMRHRARENRAVPLEVHLAKQQTRNKMNDMKADIHKEAAKLEILEREIVKETFLKPFIDPEQYNSLTANSRAGTAIIPEWLGITINIKNMEDKIKRKRNHRPQNQGAQYLRHHQDELGMEENDDLEIDADLVEVVAGQDDAEQLDVDEDESDDDGDPFDNLLDNIEEDFFEKTKFINKKLDEADKEATRIKCENIAFNISCYGEEQMSHRLSAQEKEHWRNMIPLKRRYRTILLKNLQNPEKMDEAQVRRIKNVWRIPPHDRWRLYRYWVSLYSGQIQEAIKDVTLKYEQCARRYQEILHQEDKAILEKATIIGMTTTGAARYQGVLREIGPKIVLVEEAAEVFEGHVLTSLSDQCQHVILIGDHKQLRPSPSVYKLKEKYKFDISLFERLIMNNFPYECLQYQHRMRPEISKLLRIPDLYPELKDHDLVMRYPNIIKVKGDICFIQHSVSDEQENDTKTFSNVFEAEFLIGLCEYLLQQGYTSSQITILSPYSGQIHKIKSLIETKPKSQITASKIKGLKVSSVDNYQGEENDIILLSLVRSNPANDIGFLKANNRICVALSRAKMGLYVIGNFEGLSKKSSLIQEITELSKRLGYFNDHLILTCTQHKGTTTRIEKPEDFKNVPEGGCKQHCATRLDCGHSCKRTCHADDMEHRKLKCSERCRRQCAKCQKNCRGDHRCGEHKHCTLLVQKRIPICGHIQNVPCYMEPHEFECQNECMEILPCEHTCTDVCGRLHTHTADTCKFRTEVTPKYCGHGKFRIECWKTTEAEHFLCPKPCGVELECGHLCSGTCGKCQNGRLHINCQQKCQKILICGHYCRDTCSSCPPCLLPCEVECRHSKCRRKCGELCTPCMEQCDSGCDHVYCDDLCWEPCKTTPCDLPCRQRLPCGHNCCGLCGEKCPHLCVICDKEDLIAQSASEYEGDPTTLFIELDCRHVQEVEFMDRWMETSTATSEGSDQQAIGLKLCPVCNSAIRKVDRYNKHIKKMLCSIERVKKRCIGEKQEEMKRHLDQSLANVRGEERAIITEFLDKGNQVLSETILEAQMNQINLFRQVYALSRVVKECQGRLERKERDFDRILVDLKCFQEWILQKRQLFSEQNKLDAEDERDRLSVLIDLHKIDLNVMIRGTQNNTLARSMDLVKNYIVELSKFGRAKKQVLAESKVLCEELIKLVPDTHLALTHEQRMEIIRAVNVSRGAWYTCPNGHIYAIGECGQAMEESKCPDCKAVIGGANHRLRQDNTWTGEMDDAEQPVWQNLNADRELAMRIDQRLNQVRFM